MSPLELCFDLMHKIQVSLFTAVLARSFHSIGKSSSIAPPFRYSNLGSISLGRNVQIMRDCWIQVIPPASKDPHPTILIGDNVSIGMGATISAAKSIVIEDFALFARNVYIADHGHEYHDVRRPICLQGLRKLEGVRIGYGSWLGQNVVVLPGVSIGRNSVIGANSIVQSNIPDYCVAVGTPARVIKRYDSARDRWEQVGK